MLLADENINKLGLGDLVNRFSSLKNSENSKIKILFHDFCQKGDVFDLKNIIQDIIKNKNIEMRIIDKADISADCVSIEKGELNPKLETQLFFSDNELSWARKILENCGFNENEKILAICNNIPGRTKRKMWSFENWISLIEEVLKNDPNYRIVLLPNFRDLDDQADHRIIQYVIKKYPETKIFSFQEWIGDNLQEIIKAQKLFGKSKNKIGFSIRQFGAIFFELTKNKSGFAIFNDTGLAHLAVASTGKTKTGKTISVNVENENYYKLRNGGKSFPFENEKEKTNPNVVAKFINSKIQ